MGVTLEWMSDDVLKVTDRTLAEMRIGLGDNGGDVTRLVHLWDEEMQELKGGIGLG